MNNNNNYDDDNRDIFPIDILFNRFFNLGGKRGRSLFDTTDIFRDFDDMHKEMSKMLNVFNDIPTNATKEMIREYEISEGRKVREVGPIIYGYSMTIGPDGKPHVREFRNVDAIRNKNIELSIGSDFNKPQISAEGESPSDITTTEKEVKVVLDMPGVTEKDVKINAHDDGKVEIKTANNSPRKYYKVVQLPKEANTETARFTYINGILEVTFDKKSNIKTKTKDAFVHLRNAFSNISSTILDFKNKMKYVKKQD
jgi:HSP20 family protein